MPETPIYCPYCNASVTLAPGTQPGQRVPCPRCGEAFPYRGPAIGNGDPTSTPAPTTPSGAEPAPWSNVKVAGSVLGFMALMAITGLAFALFTQKIRRAHDSGRSVTKPLPPVRTVAPANLPGLGY